jgi:hypothetical protein
VSRPSWYLGDGAPVAAPADDRAGEKPAWFLGGAETRTTDQPSRRYVATRSFLARDRALGVIEIKAGQTYVNEECEAFLDFPENFALTEPRIKNLPDPPRGQNRVGDTDRMLVRGPAETGLYLRPSVFY